LLQIRIRPEAVVNWCHQAVSKIPTACHQGLKKAAQYGLDDSQALVHVVTGELKGSGGIKIDTPERVTYGYDAAHASDEEFGTARRPAHPYVSQGYRTLESGAAADYVYSFLRVVL
jgi:hypothetical protein